MSEIFISYSNEDREIAQRLVRGLENQGWTVWWDHRIESGAEWDKSIEKALREAKCVIVLWSKSSTDSRWVRAEARDALKRNTLIPVMLEPDTAPLGFSGIQALQLTGWEGSPETEEFDQLASIIRGKLATKVTSEEPIKSSGTKKINVR